MDIEFEGELRPSLLLQPAIAKIMCDGIWRWRARYSPPGNPKGEVCQRGVEAYGDSPEEAYIAFDKAWITKIVGK